MPYRSLDADKLTATIMRLRDRVGQRFPGSGLASVCGELVELSERARDASARLTHPILPLRVLSGLLILLIATGLGATIYGLSAPAETIAFPEFVQILEAGINDLVLIAIAVFFLLTLERRLKRRKVLAAVSELRSIAHIIDIHQLTKDPQHVLRPMANTPASPTRTLDRQGLSRYLDYCSEMLSLTGKIAALYVQSFDDPVALASVNDVETLTTGLARKVWLKLMFLGSSNATSGVTT